MLCAERGPSGADRTRTNVADITALGLVEMTRKKERATLSAQLERSVPCRGHRPCAHRRGAGGEASPRPAAPESGTGAAPFLVEVNAQLLDTLLEHPCTRQVPVYACPPAGGQCYQITSRWCRTVGRRGALGARALSDPRAGCAPRFLRARAGGRGGSRQWKEAFAVTYERLLAQALAQYPSPAAHGFARPATSSFTALTRGRKHAVDLPARSWAGRPGRSVDGWARAIQAEMALLRR